MLLRSSRIKNKMESNSLAKPPQEIEPAQKNLHFEEARRLPNPEVNLSNGTVRQTLTPINTRIIPKIINHSVGGGICFIRINPETP